MDRIRVLIVDDHTLFRTGIRKMLEAEADMHVVGEAATGREALDQARTLMPDVVLMDIKMPDASVSGKALDGIAATRILHREMPHLGILFCTVFEDDEFVFSGLRAGGRGYILKDDDPDTMLRAIRAVAHGESLLGPAIAQKVIRQFSALPGTQSSVIDGLTPRELEVIKLSAELQINDRSQAILYAIREGLVKV
jgi:DNA-binding NarL/FixJ family response regulator